MVYVVGVDALFSTYAGVRERNVLFTAMTRAKGWLRVSGVGDAAQECKKEIDLALNNVPNHIYPYQSKEQLKIIRRDLAEKAIRKQQNERKLDELRKKCCGRDKAVY
jgi:superfamily I DNA and RNA helicase